VRYKISLGRSGSAAFDYRNADAVGVNQRSDWWIGMAKPALQMTQPLTSPRPEVEWLISRDPVLYEEAVRTMDAHVDAIARGEAPECVWLLEHAAIYTSGTSASAEELLTPTRFPVYASGRGGRFTYHGPGQRVAYVLLDLNARGRDVHAFVRALEDWLIAALARLGVRGERREGQIGVFAGEAKIASVGVRIRRWVTLHGVSLNVDPDLEHFSGIVPCGLRDAPVTSLAALGAETDMDKVDAALRAAFTHVFGRAPIAPNPSRAP
jgi:lipoyl(octanoyl) transferase